MLAEGRPLLALDEIAVADFVEHTITGYSDFAIHEARFFEEYSAALVEEHLGGSS